MSQFIIAVTDINTGKALYGRVSTQFGFAMQFRERSRVFAPRETERQRVECLFTQPELATAMEAHEAQEALAAVNEIAGPASWIIDPRIITKPA